MVVAHCRLPSKRLRRGETLIKDVTRYLGDVLTHTQSIIQKASEYFQLGAVRPDLVLRWEPDGEEIEVTDDILGLRPKGTTLTLCRIQRENAIPQSWSSLAQAGPRHWGSHMPSFNPLPDIPKPAGMFVWVKT